MTDDARYEVLGDSSPLEVPDDLPEVLTDEQIEQLLGGLAQSSGQDGAQVTDLCLPVVAVVGRPNVGKSTLVNRIIGRREAVVEDTPGVTRDRVRYEAEWAGVPFILVDTGGWERDSRGMYAQVSAQAQAAVHSSDLVLFVVDATVGPTDSDEAMVSVLRAARVPVLLVANKVDDSRVESDVAALWSLGLGEPWPVSALHGRGSGDLLDRLVDSLPEHGSGLARERGPHRIALLGRPNVGKSSLLNSLAGVTRSVVDSVAGTTVDPVDELVDLDGEQWLLVDTAGIRRKSKQASGQEYYATLRTKSAVDRAEVAVVLLDASEPISDQDTRIIGMAVEAGRALVVAFNKWDMLDEDRRLVLEREIERELAPVAWAPRINVSARTGWHTDRFVPALRRALAGWHTRVPTGRLNAFLSEVVAAHPHPVRGGKQPRILFGTQAAVAPPTFVLFTSGFLESGYRRFVERRLREEFGFEGSPVVINQRIREKRAR